MILHYADKELQKIINTEQGRQDKPQGIWFSPREEDGKTAWQEWCQDERWVPNQYTHLYELKNLETCSLSELGSQSRDK